MKLANDSELVLVRKRTLQDAKSIIDSEKRQGPSLGSSEYNDSIEFYEDVLDGLDDADEFTLQERMEIMVELIDDDDWNDYSVSEVEALFDVRQWLNLAINELAEKT